MKILSPARLTAGLLFFLSVLGGSVRAQNVLDYEERLAKNRPEFWAMKLVGSELMMTTMGVPRTEEPWSVNLGLEAGWLPSLSEQQRYIGFTGTKQEDVNRTPVFARPRVQVGLPGQFTASAAYIPPFKIGGIRPNMLSLSIGRPVLTVPHWRAALRIYGGFGNLKGDITCDKDTVAAGDDPVKNPYMCEAPSHDTMSIRSAGLEFGNAFPLSRTFEPYLAVAWNYFDTRFTADARYGGLIDHSRLTGAGPTVSFTTGVLLRPASRFRVTAEVFYTPLELQRLFQPLVSDGLVNVRGTVFYELR